MVKKDKGIRKALKDLHDQGLGKDEACQQVFSSGLASSLKSVQEAWRQVFESKKDKKKKKKSKHSPSSSSSSSSSSEDEEEGKQDSKSLQASQSTPFQELPKLAPPSAPQEVPKLVLPGDILFSPLPAPRRSTILVLQELGAAMADAEASLNKYLEAKIKVKQLTDELNGSLVVPID